GNGQSAAVRTGTSAAVGGAVVGLPRQQALAGRIGGQGRGQTDPSPGGVGGEHASGARLVVADSRRFESDAAPRLFGHRHGGVEDGEGSGSGGHSSGGHVSVLGPAERRALTTRS